LDPARTVYVDMDDVLCETLRGLLALLEDEFGRRIAYEDVRDFDLGRSFGLTPDELDAFLARAHHPAVLASFAPVPGARRALAAWTARGFRVAVVTGRPPSSRGCTAAWLDRHGIPYDSLRFVDKYGRFGDEAGTDGALTLEDLASLRFRLAVEDSAATAAFLAEHGVAPVVLLDRPWNRHRNDGRITRVDGWGAWVEDEPPG